MVEEEESSEIKEEKRDPSSEQGAAGGWSTFGWDISALTTAVSELASYICSLLTTVYTYVCGVSTHTVCI